MKDKIRAFLKKINFSYSPKTKEEFQNILTILKRFITQNPVLIFGLSLGPIVAISQSLKAGVSISVAFAIIIIPVVTIIGYIPTKLSKSLRVVISALLSSMFFIPAFWFAQTIFPEVQDKVVVFLPLMVVNPIINSCSKEAAKGRFPLHSFLKGVETAVGFAIVMCLVSLFRELFGNGTIWDKIVFEDGGNIAFLLPFSGFIILGFLSAGVKMLSDKLLESKKEAKK